MGPKMETASFLMDQDPAEMLAVGNVFPWVDIFLCDFHVKMAWQKKFKSLGGIILSAISFRLYIFTQFVDYHIYIIQRQRLSVRKFHKKCGAALSLNCLMCGKCAANLAILY